MRRMSLSFCLPYFLNSDIEHIFTYSTISGVQSKISSLDLHLCIIPNHYPCLIKLKLECAAACEGYLKLGGQLYARET